MIRYGPANGQARFFTQSMCAELWVYPSRFHHIAEKAKMKELRNGLLLTNHEKHITLLACFDPLRNRSAHHTYNDDEGVQPCVQVVF